MASEIYYPINALATELSTIEGIQNVLSEFPRPDQQLNLPSISITTVRGDISPRMPTIVEKTPSGEPNQLNTLQVLGEYNLQLMLDIWCEYKAQREHYYNEVLNVFDSGIPDDNTQALKIELADYHNVFAQFDITGYRYSDNDNSSLKGEWRVSLDVSCHFARVKLVPTAEFTDITTDITITT